VGLFRCSETQFGASNMWHRFTNLLLSGR